MANAWETYKVNQRDLKYSIRSAKRQSWRSFTSDISNEANLAKFTRSLSRPKGKNMGLIRDPNANDKAAEDPQETSAIIMDSFFPGSITIDSVNSIQKPIVSLNYRDISNDKGLEEVFDIHKIQTAITTMGAYKAPGPDGFSPIVLKNMSVKTLKRLQTIFKVTYYIGYVPMRWRHSLVIYLPKPGKDNYDQVQSFRPITLACSCLKLQE